MEEDGRKVHTYYDGHVFVKYSSFYKFGLIWHTKEKIQKGTNSTTKIEEEEQGREEE
jgi:hypothetical protein